MSDTTLTRLAPTSDVGAIGSRQLIIPNELQIVPVPMPAPPVTLADITASQSLIIRCRANLPNWLKSPARRIWLLWRFVPNRNGKKPKKVPYYACGQVRRGKLDIQADRSRLVSFDEICEAFLNGNYEGIGIALGADGNGDFLQGIDLDNSWVNPKLSVLSLPGYVESSPSMKGLHAIGYGRDFDTLSSNLSGVESYAKLKFFTVTGWCGEVLTGHAAPDILAAPVDVADYVERVLIPLHAEGKQKTKPTPLSGELIPASCVHLSGEQIADLLAALAYIPDDFDTWIKVGLALFSLGDDGFRIWKAWSLEKDKESGKYEDDCCEEQWRTFNPVGIDYRALFNLGELHGWVNPRRHVIPHPDSVGFGLDPLPIGASTTPVYAIPPANDSRFKIIPAADFINAPPTVWLIKGILPRAVLAMVYGESGSGKSFLVLDLACAVSQGIPWCGRKTLKGRVVYIAAEGAGGMRKRLKAYQQKYGVDLSKMSLDFIDDAPDFTLGDYSVLAQRIGDASLIVVDTLACCTSGDENSAQDMNIVLSNCKKLHALTGATVVLVHHSGKDSTKGARGSSTLRGAMDCMIEITRSGDLRFAKIVKQKDGVDGIEIPFTFESIALEVDVDREPVTSCVVNYGKIQVNEHTNHQRHGKWEQAILDAIGLHDCALRGDVINKAVSLMLSPESGKKDNRKSNLNRTLQGLINKNMVVVHGEWLCKQGCQPPTFS